MTVDHPSHYRAGSGHEAIDVIEAWGLGFNLGNVVKYVSRAGLKGDPVEDLEKARWYLDREIGTRRKILAEMEAEYAKAQAEAKAEAERVMLLGKQEDAVTAAIDGILGATASICSAVQHGVIVSGAYGTIWVQKGPACLCLEGEEQSRSFVRALRAFMQGCKVQCQASDVALEVDGEALVMSQPVEGEDDVVIRIDKDEARLIVDGIIRLWHPEAGA